MNRKQKKTLIRILAAAGLLIIIHFLPADGTLQLGLYLIPYLLVGYDIILEAYKGVRNLQAFDENLLMTIATLGALAIAYLDSGEYLEAIAVMLFYQVGELFQSYAVGKSRKNISELMDIVPEYANVDNDGSLEQVAPDEVEIGTIITVLPGERIPLDGLVVSGRSTLNTSALTGESLPRDVKEGDEVLSGCINFNGVLRVKTEKEFEDSTASKIIELVEDASSRKSRSENFITRFARVYTPLVVISAIAIAIIPPLVLMITGNFTGWETWIYRALTFLVISCPCALVISIPLSFFGGIGGASSQGILIKGSNYMEMLADTDTVVFDKTGTLTKGEFLVSKVNAVDMSENDLVSLAAFAEKYSKHPLALAIKKADKMLLQSDSPLKLKLIEQAKDNLNSEEIAGFGVKTEFDGKLLFVGNSKLMGLAGVNLQPSEDLGTIIHVAFDGKYAGNIVVSDQIKEGAKESLKALKTKGVNKTVMLTGDNEMAAGAVARELEIDDYYSMLLPVDKVKHIEDMISNRGHGKAIAFVGDGINDAPVLARADIGIAMGAMGSDAAVEAADVVLMDDDPAKVAKAIGISKKCMKIVKQNTFFAIGIKLACLLLGAFGLANMWMAIFADVGVMILAIINAMRTLFAKTL